MSFLFSLKDRRGLRVFAICDELPERDILDYADESAMSPGADPDDAGNCPFVQTDDGTQAVDCLVARGWEAEEITVAPELAAELPAMPVQEWQAELAAVFAVYSDVLTLGESALHPVDNYFLWDLWRGWYQLQRTPAGLLGSALKERAQTTGTRTYNAWGIEGVSGGQQFYFGLFIDSDVSSVRVTGSDDDSLHVMRGEQPDVRVEIRTRIEDTNHDLAQRLFGSGLPKLIVEDSAGSIVPSLPLLRGLTLMTLGLTKMLRHDYPDGVPDSPSIGFRNSFGEVSEEANLFAYSASEVAEFLGTP